MAPNIKVSESPKSLCVSPFYIKHIMKVYSHDEETIKIISDSANQELFTYPIIRRTEVIQLYDKENKRYHYIIKSTFNRFIKDAELIPRIPCS